MFCLLAAGLKYGDIEFSNRKKNNILISLKSTSAIFSFVMKNIEFIVLKANNETRPAFVKAIDYTQYGNVSYITSEEIVKLPDVFEDGFISKQKMQRLTIMYVKNLAALIEVLASIHSWKNIPSVLVIENLDAFNIKDTKQSLICIIALVVDACRSCFNHGLEPLKGILSFNDEIDQIKELICEFYPLIDFKFLL